MLLFALITLDSFGRCSLKLTLLQCFSDAVTRGHLGNSSFETQECSSHTPLHTSWNFGTIGVFSSQGEINVLLFNKMQSLCGPCRVK